MDILKKLEIFIPVEAEVKTVPLSSLPRSVQRRIDSRPPRPDGAGGASDPPEGTWIFPVLLRTRGRRAALRSANGVAESLSSILSSQARSLQSPLEMSIVSPNRAAYGLLRGSVPGRLTPHPSRSRLAGAPLSCQGAVVLYRGNVYLSIKRRTRRHRDKTTSQSAPTSSSVVSSTSQRKEELSDHRPEEQLGPAGGEQLLKEALAQEEVAGGGGDGEEARRPGGEADGGAGGGRGQSSSSSSLDAPCDFRSLAQQERIAQMKAKLQAAANKL